MTAATAPTSSTGGSRLPTPPGRLGQAASREELLDFLFELSQWLDQTRGELDRLDAVAQKAPDSEAHSSDVVLAMALWQALRTRADAIGTEWDSGRADTAARERISGLIWGRLGSGVLDVTLAEGARLVTALVGSLREKLAIDPSTVQLVSRLRAVRAEVVRCEDVVRSISDPELTSRVGELADRQARLLTQAQRGADVTGPLGELEADVARTHRDLLVTATRSGELRRDRERAIELRDALAERRPVLVQMRKRCLREIANAPRLAIPDVTRLGEPPEDRAGTDRYLARLNAVTRAVDKAENAFTQPLRERASLRYRLAQAQSQAQAHGRDASPTVRAGWQEASDAVTAIPCDVPLARALVAQYERLAAPLDLGPPSGTSTTPIGGSR